jgi:hypothetical protein
MRNMPTHDEEPWEHDRRRLGDAKARVLWEQRRREMGLRERGVLNRGGKYETPDTTRRFAKILSMAVALAVCVTLAAAWTDTQEPPGTATAARRVVARSHAHRRHSHP